MATPLTERNLAICITCTDCISGRPCRYIKKGGKFKFSVPKHIYHIERSKRIKKSKWIKKLDHEKFGTPESRIIYQTSKLIKLGKIQKPEICQECGKSGKLDTHHPDYNHPEIFEFLCRICHSKKADRGKVHKRLDEVAREKRLMRLEEKYGTNIKKIFLDYYNQAELTMVDLGELLGVSRERVRQFLVQIHGTSKKNVITEKCMVSSSNPLTAMVLSKLICMGLKPEKIDKHNAAQIYKLINNKVIGIHKLGYFKPYNTEYYRFQCLNFHKLDYLISNYMNETYIIPIHNKKAKGSIHYLKIDETNQYKEAWHLLKD